MNKKYKSIIFSFLNIVFTMLLIGTFYTFNYYLVNLDIIPFKLLFKGYIAIGILFIVLLMFMYLSKRVFFKILSYIPVMICSFAFIVMTGYLHNTNSFIENVSVKEEKHYLNYSVVTLKAEKYQSISDLVNEDISYFDDDYLLSIKNALNKLIGYEEVLAYDIGTLANSLLDREVSAICVEDSILELINDEVEDFRDNIQVIYTFKIDLDDNVVNVFSEDDIKNDHFILYISGIDQYGDVNNVRGRSDVNILAIVNMHTKHILLVNTPRDYYVQLAGTEGLKDKLTHAGIYGIEKSVNTLEELYDIDIDYYLKVNFNTLINVVDVIGGVDIYSDSAFGNISKGWNHLDGKGALAYSRERYAYITGDNHRGANQQQVITAIIDKVSQSSVLIKKYNSILSALDGSFQTNIPKSVITSFIRLQLNNMSAWQVESMAVVGTDSMNYTYSMGTNYLLYVMEPDLESVSNAKNRINDVLVEE